MEQYNINIRRAPLIHRASESDGLLNYKPTPANIGLVMSYMTRFLPGAKSFSPKETATAFMELTNPQFSSQEMIPDS